MKVVPHLITDFGNIGISFTKFDTSFIKFGTLHKIWYIMKDVPNFGHDIPRVLKCVPRWGSTPNHFLMGF